MRPRHRRVHHPAPRRERGAVLVIVGCCMVGVLIIAGMVVDLGQMRAMRRSNQSVSDLAALAAGFYLAGNASSTVDAASDPVGACKAAVNSVRANVGNFPSGAGVDCDSLPFSAAAPCTDSSAPVTVTATNASPFTLRIEYPVPASDIADSRYAGGVGKDDGTKRCDRMKVEFGKTTDAVFSRIIGVSSVSASARSVVRGSISDEIEGVAALLLLERVGCGTLQTSGGGSAGMGVVVLASSPKVPGIIHADSAGWVPPCTTNQNATGYVIYGTALPSGQPSIVAAPSSDGTAGIVRVHGLKVGGRGGAVEGTGISPGVTGGDVMSRRKADDQFNTPTTDGGNAQISSLHTRAYSRTTMTPATATSLGYRVLTGNNTVCKALDTTAMPVTETKVYVDCPNGVTVVTAIFPNATDVIFNGKVAVPNNALLSLPNASRVYVRGCTSGCNGSGDYGVSVDGELRVNTGGDGTTAPACSTRKGPGAGGTTTNWTELATLGGPLYIGGSAHLCQTFVYLGENSPTYTIRQQTANGVLPENYPPIAGCSTTRPCPSTQGGTNAISMKTGAATADWSAPNQLSVHPSKSDYATYPFEDLALWSESPTASELKGQGANRTEGIFFTPNSLMTFTGQADQNQPLNAQFIARGLIVSGQGTLTLRPNLADSITMKFSGTAKLIR